MASDEVLEHPDTRWQRELAARGDEYRLIGLMHVCLVVGHGWQGRLLRMRCVVCGTRWGWARARHAWRAAARTSRPSRARGRGSESPGRSWRRSVPDMLLRAIREVRALRRSGRPARLLAVLAGWSS